MPKMDGLQTLKEIMKRTPTPTIIITAAEKSEYADLYFEALQLGAFDIITKPSGEDALNLEKMKNVIEDRIRYAIKAPPQVLNVSTRNLHKKQFGNKKKPPNSASSDAQIRSLLIIGASAGGPKAIFNVISNLRYVPNLAICVIQHMPENFTKSLANRIELLAEFHAKEAEDGEVLKTGWIFVAPGNRHMELVENGGKINIEINQKERIRACRPSIDLFINSAMKVFDPDRMIGVLLSGMGEDGAAGLLLIKENGGKTITQDKETAEIWGMPKKAAEIGAADYILPIDEIGEKINVILRN
jgi:two-component system chemotaxis response regulator CheB